MITYNADGVKMPKIKRKDTTAWIKAVAQTYGKKVGEVGYMFVNDEKILEINNEYLGHDYYTDVITFDYDEDDVVNGDIVISLSTPCELTLNCSTRRTKTNSTVLSYMGYFTYAGSTTRVRGKGKSWKRLKTKPWK